MSDFQITDYFSQLGFKFKNPAWLSGPIAGAVVGVEVRIENCKCGEIKNFEYMNVNFLTYVRQNSAFEIDYLRIY